MNEITPAETAKKSPKPNFWRRTKGLWGLLWLGWMVVSFIAIGMFNGWWTQFIPRGLLDGANPTLLNTLYNAFIYVLLLIITLGAPMVFYRVLRPKIAVGWKKLLGLTRGIHWRDLGYAIVGFGAYYGILFVGLIILQLVLAYFGVTGFDAILQEEQSVGFNKVGNSIGELVLIFVALVVIPPICEEITMRGLLFGKLSSRMSFWPSAILVSLLFAVLHGQLNVGIDTFVLSMTACYLRVKTGSIWAGIILHMLKNGVAYALLFIL